LNKWAVVHNCMDSECPSFLLVYGRIKQRGIRRHVTVTSWPVMQLWVSWNSCHVTTVSIHFQAVPHCLYPRKPIKGLQTSSLT
jgi:hypothetical protein